MLAGEIVEGVAGEEVGQKVARGMPIAGEVSAAGDADVFGGAKMFEVVDGDGVFWATLEPGGGVDFVADFATLHEGIEPVFPETVINKTDGEGAADAQGLEDNAAGIGEFVDGAGADDAVEMFFGEGAHESDHVALIRGEAAADARRDLGEVEIDADGGDFFSLGEVVEEDPGAAAEIEDAGVRLDPAADNFHIDGALNGLDQWGGWGGFHSEWSTVGGWPRSRNWRTKAYNSSDSRRKES